MPIYDISQTVSEKIAVWPGDQKFRPRWTMQIRRGDSCNVSAVAMSVHTGTHVDAPLHFEESGADVASVPLQPYLGQARVIQVPEDHGLIGADYLAKQDWNGVERALFKTRASALTEQEFHRDYAYLTEDGAEFLGKRGLLLVGTDAPSVDAFASKNLLSHRILLSHGVAILEGLRLGLAPPGDYELICLPLKLAGLDASPVRAVLRH